jgi:hypothetical protein
LVEGAATAWWAGYVKGACRVVWLESLEVEVRLDMVSPSNKGVPETAKAMCRPVQAFRRGRVDNLLFK